MADDLDVIIPHGASVAHYPAGASYGPRAMTDFEFVWLIEGDARYTWGDTTVDAPEGAVVLCRPGATDFFRWDERRRTRHGFVHFQVRRHPQAWGDAARWPLVRLPADGDILRPLLAHLITWSQDGDPLLRRLTVMQLLTAFVRGEIATGGVPPAALPDAVERALAHIHRRLEKDAAADIDLRELARAGGVTPEHLCRLFTAATGLSPVRTVLLARIDRAAVLLARSNYAVAEIAAMCGFSSPFHFSRRFKEVFRVSPDRARRQARAHGAPMLLRCLPSPFRRR